MIADGKELITGNERGELVVPELKDEKVYITFKDDVTNLSGSFMDCSALKSIPENLFANCPNVTTFFSEKGIEDEGAFMNCTSLTTIPEKLFANNPAVTSFFHAFEGCTALTGESPYTMIGDQKVHLYERANYPEHFTAPTDFQTTFYGCTGLTDYAQIPSDWKE